MTNSPAYPRDPPLGRLWFGVAAAPLAWSVAELTGYISAGRSCSAAWPDGRAFGYSDPRLWVTITVAAMILLGVAGLLVAIGNSRATRRGSRAAFMANGGVVASSLFLLGTVFFALPALITNLCRNVR